MGDMHNRRENDVTVCPVRIYCSAPPRPASSTCSLCFQSEEKGGCSNASEQSNQVQSSPSLPLSFHPIADWTIPLLSFPHRFLHFLSLFLSSHTRPLPRPVPLSAHVRFRRHSFSFSFALFFLSADKARKGVRAHTRQERFSLIPSPLQPRPSIHPSIHPSFQAATKETKKKERDP